MASFDPDDFRLAFPEFASKTKYPEAVIDFWSGVGISLLNEARWGDLLTQGLFLYTAHSIVLAQANTQSEAFGSNAGEGSGLLTGKAAGGISVNYDTSAVTIEKAGDYNSTSYGRQFYKLAMLVGIGGLQV